MRERTGRSFEIVTAALLMGAVAPILLAAMLAIWLEDRRAPLYRARRLGRGGQPFSMLKLRTMVCDAELQGGRLAPEGDPRVTRVGRLLRRWKIDELPQFANVLRGEMALVGPRPDTLCAAEDYAAEDLRLLAVRPGITCFASILFFDEGRALARVADPLAHYQAVIRPQKLRLGLAWLEHRSRRSDAAILGLTMLAFVARPLARRGVAAMLRAREADGELLALCGPADQLASRSGSPAAARG
ncbi:sugar transferase [Sphingomonas sp. HITSZ_GF]|uniref:sugar transferase n=1 Tax=Sphingomonas sp. HITSZ_GF TaxID=3037247 RepID=UPI00240D4F5D|nr:sugar transferase [Sphingomonas sp. HITSZ_GF]MDG2535756.1 sugar transferase [Sphingomonas sp. HITSZ_GF]